MFGLRYVIGLSMSAYSLLALYPAESRLWAAVYGRALRVSSAQVVERDWPPSPLWRAFSVSVVAVGIFVLMIVSPIADSPAYTAIAAGWLISMLYRSAPPGQLDHAWSWVTMHGERVNKSPWTNWAVAAVIVVPLFATEAHSVLGYVFTIASTAGAVWVLRFWTYQAKLRLSVLLVWCPIAPLVLAGLLETYMAALGFRPRSAWVIYGVIMAVWLYAAVSVKRYRAKAAFNLWNGALRGLLAIVFLTRYMDVSAFFDQPTLPIAQAIGIKAADLPEYLLKASTLPFVVAGTVASCVIELRQYLADKRKEEQEAAAPGTPLREDPVMR